MKWLSPVLVSIALGLGSEAHSAEQATNSVQHRFQCELQSIQSGSLRRSHGSNSNYSDLIRAVFVDSNGRVWVGSVKGLAVFDGEQWMNRTFQIAEPVARVVVGLLDGSASCGPTHIAEGPPGTIWLGGNFGVWRFRDGRYEEISSSSKIAGMLGMGVDRAGYLWVVDKQFVHKFDGQSWTTVLCPYVGRPASIEAPGLHGIAVETNGNVWIGGTVYGKPKEPWEHEGVIWVVDQESKKRNEGPPMAPLFEFDGRSWKAFGAPHGMDVKSATPELDGQGRIVVRTPGRNYYIRTNETWKVLNQADVNAGKLWVLRERRKGALHGYAELLFRDGKDFIPVRPIGQQKGEALDLESEQLASLCMAEDRNRNCVWLGTFHGLYRIWLEEQKK